MMCLMKEKIVIIGGCGHVGIPLGLALASKEFDVTLLDKNQVNIDMINAGRLPFQENGADEILQKHIGRNLRASVDYEYIRNADIVFFVIGTPVDDHLNPKVRDVIAVIGEYVPYLADNQLLIMRSTLFPGTLRVIQEHLNRKGLKSKLAFCPERILQGKGNIIFYVCRRC